jgi:hypothetical protein
MIQTRYSIEQQVPGQLEVGRELSQVEAQPKNKKFKNIDIIITIDANTDSEVV